jgi:hypothetical protein
VTETIDTGGALSCRSTRIESVPLEVVLNGSREAVGLIGDADVGIFGASDVLRTYCSGPDDADITDGIALIGQGSVRPARLGAAMLAITLRHHARFRNLDYAGGWGGPLRFQLRLTGVRVGTTNRPVRVLHG